MSNVRDQVAEEVRALFARRRLSARAAADALGWTPMYLSRRMRGQAPFNVDDLAALARLLDVPVTAFFPEVPSGTTSELSLSGHETIAPTSSFLTLALADHVPVVDMAA